jgi:hypothetical protein
LNIVSLLEFDYKISQLSVLPDESLYEIVEQENGRLENKIDGFFVSQLIAAGTSYDEQHFTSILSHCFLRFGIRDSYIRVIYPMLIRIGILWSCEKISAGHEHFISNLLRQKLFTAIDSLPPARGDAASWLLFLPENEFHETGLLIAQYLVRLAGNKSVYLGTNVPFDSLQSAAASLKPDYLLTFLVHGSLPGETQDFLDELRGFFKGKRIFVAGAFPAIPLKISPKIKLLQSVSQLEDELK